jgi:hypothetical protein
VSELQDRLAAGAADRVPYHTMPYGAGESPGAPLDREGPLAVAGVGRCLRARWPPGVRQRMAVLAAEPRQP